MIKREISYKLYKCSHCGFKEEHQTNHWGEIYINCKQCLSLCPFVPVKTAPKGAWIPEKWKIVKLGDICSIK